MFSFQDLQNQSLFFISKKEKRKTNQARFIKSNFSFDKES